MADEDRAPKKTTFLLPVVLFKKLKHYAIDNDKTDSEVAVEALEALLDNRGPKGVRSEQPGCSNSILKSHGDGSG